MDDINYRDDETLNTLRELRNKLSDMSYKIQKKIDNIILEKNDFSKYNKQFLCVENHDGKVYMYVTTIRRLNNGCRLIGIAYRYDEDDLLIIKDFLIDYELNSNTKITIITEDEFYNKLSEFYQNMKCEFQKIIKDDRI